MANLDYEVDKREELDILKGELENERQSIESFWQDCSDYIMPDVLQLDTVQDSNQGRKIVKIIDSTASFAAQTFASNIMAGYTSPSKIWARVTTQDPEIAKIPIVEEWLFLANRLMSSSMLHSNLYNQLPLHYEILASFGTSAVLMEEDRERVFMFTTLAPGTYWVGDNEHGQCRIFMRKFRMTVANLVKVFKKPNSEDWGNISDYVKDQWENKQRQTKVEIVHFVRESKSYYPNKKGAKRYESCYYESGASTSYAGGYDHGRKFLKEGGFDYWPLFAVRYKKLHGDAYAISWPGRLCLGDIKSLQIQHRQLAKAIEKTINPPMNAPGNMKSVRMTTLPGETNYLNVRSGEQGFSPVYQISFDPRQLERSIETTQARINGAFMTNFFLALSSDYRNQRATAREVEEIHDEKIAMVGPLLEQLDWEQSDPLVVTYFLKMLQQGKIPPPPQELFDEEIKVEYSSIMNQAQKSIGVRTSERFMSFTSQLAPIYPQIVNKMKIEEWVEEYADSLGVSPKVTNSKEEFEQIEAAQRQKIEQARALEATQMASDSAKNLGSVDMEKDTALTRLINQGA